MKEIICYTNYLPKDVKQNVTFMDLLLNEEFAKGIILCPKDVFNRVGDINRKLNAKQNYEFLLRAISEYPLTIIGVATPIYDANTLLSPDTTTLLIDNRAALQSPWDGYCTDCYIAGKYQKELLKSNYFNLVIETLLEEASSLPKPKEAISWLEKMISHAPEYYEIDDNTQPILIYLGSDICCNTLNLFAQQLADSLGILRQRITIFNIAQEGNQALTQFIGKRFKAIIGIQTYAFSIMMQDNKTNLHDLILGPKYNMILDHPAWMKEHIENGPKDYYLLIHDRNYLAFAKHYYTKIQDCFLFPPAGILPSDILPEEKMYDITFIGSYFDYRKRLAIIKSYARPYRFIAARFLHIMRRNPDYPTEQAFHETLEYYHIDICDADFLDLFYEMRQVCFCIMTYYREKIINTLLNAGVIIHVYSESWKNAPFAKHPCLICHPAIPVEESLKIMAQSRISLNIMSWHKDGLTERIFNAMLCHSSVLSDRSTALEDAFINGHDLMLFSLQNLSTLPSLVETLLKDEKKQQILANNGYAKAFLHHQWINRAEQLLEIIQLNLS